MQEKVVVVGAGHAGAQVVGQLRDQGFTGEIVLLGNEGRLPYQRPPLSKQFLKGEFEENRLYFKPQSFYQEKAIDLELDYSVQQIDVDQRSVLLEDGRRLQYDHCVIAAGASLRKLDVSGSDLTGIHYLRGINDSLGIKDALHNAKRLVICGAGYIGLEIAAVAREFGVGVTLIEMAPTVLARVAPPEVAAFYQQLHKEAGVDVQTGKVVSAFEGATRVEKVICDDGSTYDADLVVVGIGVIPNTDLADQAGLEVEHGIVVDQYCRTSNSQIYAIGDCAVHYNERYQRRLCLESVQNALGQAKTAAASICGQAKPYVELPWFWSDQYGIKLQIAGLHEHYDEVVRRGELSDQKFAYFYLKNGILNAVYAVNDPQSFMFSKKLISERVTVDSKDLLNPEVAIKDLA